MDISTLGAAKSYTDTVINGLSILVGKNCEISNIEVLPNGNKITFTWWDSNNVQQSNDITVLNGEQGIQGLQGVSTTNVEINEENHLIFTLSDSTIIDAGEIINDVTNYENLNNKPTINGVELIGNKSTSDLGIEIPTVTNDLTNVLKSNYDTAYTHSQSAHAPSNAEANVQSDWNETDNTSDAFIQNKPTSLPASDVSSWAKEPIKPTYTASEVGLGNVDNTSDLDKPISTATQTALDTKASTTTLTAHTDNNNIHVTAEDKTAWNMMPKSKGESYSTDTHSYQDFIIPILNIASTYSNEYFYGQIYLKHINAVSQQMTIINLMCGKNYNEEKAVYYIDRSEIWTSVKPCSFMYNGKKMFGIHVKITSSDYNILRVDARTTTDFDSITPVYIYNNNTSAVLNAEIYNSLTFFDGYNMPMNFYEIPKVIKSDGTATKLLSFSSVPATLTSSGTVGDIAYDTSYMYICTATNTWKKIKLGEIPTATTDLLGGVKIGNGINVNEGKISTTCTTKTYGKAITTEGWYRICDLGMLLTDKTATILLNRNYTNTANETYIISFCYSHNKPVFNLINSSVGSSGITKIRVVYNSNSAYNTHMYLEIYYALNVLNTVSSAIFYNTTEAQQFIPVNFTAGEIPAGYYAKEFELTQSKLLSFSSVPTTLDATGTAGEIAYDSNYMYTCIATNTWKKTAFDVYTYSTTETVVGTYMGKPLYRKIVDCGALPNNTTKGVTHGIANINIFTNITGSAWDSNDTTIPLPTASLTSPVVIYSDKSKIYIITITDRSTFINSNVVLEYTKTTD